MEQTRKCPICEEPYVVYPYFGGDQSACPECREKARSKSRLKRWTAQEGARREREHGDT